MADQPMFTEACLDSSMRRESRNETLALLNTRLHPALQAIVAAEVASGNRVSDAGVDWPEPGSVHVTLSKRFDNRHANAAASFSLCSDPHYWHASYETNTAGEPTHLLIC
jgi:hypothetical protein